MRRGPKSLARLTATCQHLRTAMPPVQVLTSITRFNTKACSNAEDQEEQTEWEPIASSSGHSVVRVVLESKNHKHQNSTGDELGEEHAGLGHVRLGICAKNSCCCCRARRYCTDPMPFESIDVIDIVAIYDASGNQSAQELCQEVYRESSPRKLAKKAIGEGDRWVQIRS